MEIQNQTPIVHQELLEQCRRGDPRAQMKLYKLYYKPMYNVSLRIVGDRMEAEDIMQESFLSAFEHLKRTDLSVSFGGWLKKIVINRSLDALKKRKVFFEPVENLPDTSASVADEWDEGGMAVDEKVGLIRRAMEKLPEKYRVVLSLSLFEGYDHDEIGEILGIQPSTSRAQLSRGRQKLLQMIT